jgi:hypothetical protein
MHHQLFLTPVALHALCSIRLLVLRDTHKAVLIVVLIFHLSVYIRILRQIDHER